MSIVHTMFQSTLRSYFLSSLPAVFRAAYFLVVKIIHNDRMPRLCSSVGEFVVHKGTTLSLIHISTVENGLVRHNPGHLAWELVRLHAQRNIRLVEDSLRRTPRNRVEK